MRTVIIGYGNPLRCDDAVGWVVAHHLGQYLGSADAQAIACHQLTPELANLAGAAELVIFVDACYGSPAGKVSCVRVAPELSTTRSLGHQASPSQLLGLASATTRRKAPRAYLITVSGESFGYGEELSPAVRHACDEVLHQISDTVLREGGAVLKSGGVPITEMYGYA